MTGDREAPGFQGVRERLAEEFTGTHPRETVALCISAARHGAKEATGAAPPDLVERVARKHLQVLATVAAEKRRQITLGNAP